MKFTIFFLLLLTLWIALAAQIFFSFTRAKKYTQQQVSLVQETAALEDETEFWQTKKFDSKVLSLQTDRDQLKDLTQSLSEAFTAELPELSKVISRDNVVSIRRIPVLNRPKETVLKLKFFVPKSRKISLHVELKPIGDDKEKSFAGVDWRPERSVKILLSPGIHIVDFKYKHLDESTWFAAQLDGKEIARFTFNSPQSGFSYSAQNFNRQYDFGPKKSLPPLLDLKPPSDVTQILCYLSESEE